MVITRVSYIRKSLVLLYIDGEEALKVDKETFTLSPYKEGSYIDDEGLYELVKTSEKRRAREKALYLLERKNYSKKELIRKLKLDSSDETAIEIAERMEEVGLINDKTYAELCVRDMSNIKKYGKQRIKTELFRKGFEKEVIEEVLLGYESDESENIAYFLERKYPNWDTDEKVKRRAIAALQRKGYSWDEIKKVLRSEYYD